MLSRLRRIARDTAELHLRSGSTFLGLYKEYLSALNEIVRAPEKTAERQRSPLLLAGEAEQEASGAFVISNPSSNDLNVTLAVQSQLLPDAVTLMPKSLILKPAEEAIVRI